VTHVNVTGSFQLGFFVLNVLEASWRRSLPPLWNTSSLTWVVLVLTLGGYDAYGTRCMQIDRNKEGSNNCTNRAIIQCTSVATISSAFDDITSYCQLRTVYDTTVLQVQLQLHTRSNVLLHNTLSLHSAVKLCVQFVFYKINQ
jgi:hypothetical protein